MKSGLKKTDALAYQWVSEWVKGDAEQRHSLRIYLGARSDPSAALACRMIDAHGDTWNLTADSVRALQFQAENADRLRTSVPVVGKVLAELCEAWLACHVLAGGELPQGEQENKS
jgi:hypothetical protein